MVSIWPKMGKIEEARPLFEALDPDDTALTVILTGPLVVGHWIMMQYYGSTVAPEVFGSGSKTLHNVTAGIGVRVGPGGDIRTGLPEQSVRHGSRIQHQPLRPLAVVDAPLEKVERVISRQTQLDRLVRGRWVSVVARDGTGGHWCERMDDGTWQPIAATAGIKEVTR